MRQKRSVFRLSVIMLSLSVLLASCLKQAYDSPPDLSGYDPMLAVTHSISSLKRMNGYYDYKTGGDTTLIGNDVVIAGVVTANDRTGNFYKQIVVEDTSAAIILYLDANNLFNDYPVGRKIYVRCNGLCLGYDAGLPVLGMAPLEQMVPAPIPRSRIADFIVKASVGQALPVADVDLVTIKEANQSFYNRRIRLHGVQFADTVVNYAQPNGAGNRIIKDCYGNTIVLRTSNFASFASMRLPAGNGSLTGIYTVYTSASTAAKTPQLIIDDTSDVGLSEPRCDEDSLLLPPLISIDSLRKTYNGSLVQLPPGCITGIVISDRLKKNIDAKNLVLQQDGAGIIVRFSAIHNFNVGDSLRIDISGAQLGTYKDLLQVGSIAQGSTFKTSTAQKLAEDIKVIPLQLTIQQLMDAAFDQYESTLVKIVNATVAANASFTDGYVNTSRRLEDGTGQITLFTYGTASFGDDLIPDGPRQWTGIPGRYGTVRQFSIRNLSDVQ